MMAVNSAKPDAVFAIVVPTVALADQWVVGLSEDLGVSPAEIAVSGGGRRIRSYKKVNVFVINSARSQVPELARSLPTALIVDECHRAASEENARALSGPFVATLGLSATPEREWDDLYESVLVPALGGPIAEYGYNAASRDGAISPFELVNVKVPMAPDEEAEYSRVSRQIARAGRASTASTEDERLKRLLRQRARISAGVRSRLPMAIRLIEKHRLERSIIFHEDISAADILCQTLLARNHRAAVYHSGVGDRLRQDNLRLFRRGEIDVLVTCRALDEGVNVPDARVAVIAASTASTRQRIQRLGRVLRPAPGKESATVYTIYASKPEEDRLRREAEKLEGAREVSWLKESR